MPAIAGSSSIPDRPRLMAGIDAAATNCRGPGSGRQPSLHGPPGPAADYPPRAPLQWIWYPMGAKIDLVVAAVENHRLPARLAFVTVVDAIATRGPDSRRGA